MKSFDDPVVLRGLSDNSITDIVEHNGAVWMSTGAGLSFHYFDSLFWNQYNRNNGLTGDAVSAMYSAGETLWVAGNHFDTVGTEEITVADGLFFTDDDGQTWHNLEVENTTGAYRVVYDIDGVDDKIFCASWIGGLIGSFDGGQTWKNIYFNASDSITATDPGYLVDDSAIWSNMYFSAVVDTTHPDSLVLWAGCVAGLRRFIYAPSYLKPNSRYILDCSAADSFVYICGDRGLTRIAFDSTAADTLGTFFWSSFVSDGLPGPTVTAAYELGDRLFVGTAESVDGEGTGVAVSDDYGVSFSSGLNGLDDVTGSRKYAVEFAAVGSHLFMAALDAGLYVSSDTGQNWQKVYLDSADTTLDNGRNVINSIAADSSNLWIGTDSGVVLAYISDLGAVDSTKYTVFDDAANSGIRSYRVGVQNISATEGVIDSTIIWSINHPLDTAVGDYAVFYSNNYGETWSTDELNLVGTKYNDMAFINNLIYLVGLNVFNQSPNRIFWYPTPGSLIKDRQLGTITFSGLDLTSIFVRSDTIFLGSENGFAISPPGGSVNIIWSIYRANTDPAAFDKVTTYIYPYISGNFVNVLDIQPLDDGQSRVWASTRAAATGEVVAVSTSTVDGLNWNILLTGLEAWNFAFNGPEVFAATSYGLQYSPDTGYTWQTITIDGVLAPPASPAGQDTTANFVSFSMDSNTFITAVTVMRDTLWVGTLENGAARIALEDIGTDNWEIFRFYDDAADIYAYPVPFSMNGNEYLYFHYPVKKEGYVTIEVFDFAMDLVATPVQNEFKTSDVYFTDRWDGRLESGAPIAVGIYYFKVSISSGETYWGKLAIIP